MTEYRAKLGNNGRFVIPSSCRKQLHLQPGEELILRVENCELHVLSLKRAVKNAQLKVQQYTSQYVLTDKLAALRNEDE